MKTKFDRKLLQLQSTIHGGALPADPTARALRATSLTTSVRLRKQWLATKASWSLKLPLTKTGRNLFKRYRQGRVTVEKLRTHLNANPNKVYKDILRGELTFPKK